MLFTAPPLSNLSDFGPAEFQRAGSKSANPTKSIRPTGMPLDCNGFPAGLVSDIILV